MTMRGRRSGFVLALVLAGCASTPSSPPPSVAPATAATAGPRDPVAPPRPAPAAPAEAGARVELAGVRCLAPARLGLVRLGAGATLPDALGPLGASLAVLDGRAALLVAGGRAVDATSATPLTMARDGGAEPVVTSLGRRASGVLVLVIGDQLVARTREGLVTLVPLPGAGWQVTCGAGAVYVHDPAARPGALHVIDDELRSTKLLELEAGVGAVCPTPGGVAVATPGAVWTLTPDGGPVAALRLDGYAPCGLAHDPRTGTLFASDGQGVLAIVDGVPLPLVEGLGGALACVDEGDGTALFVLDGRRRVLARVAPLDWIGR